MRRPGRNRPNGQRLHQQPDWGIHVSARFRPQPGAALSPSRSLFRLSVILAVAARGLLHLDLARSLGQARPGLQRLLVRRQDPQRRRRGALGPVCGQRGLGRRTGADVYLPAVRRHALRPVGPAAPGGGADPVQRRRRRRGDPGRGPCGPVLERESLLARHLPGTGQRLGRRRPGPGGAEPRSVARDPGVRPNQRPADGPDRRGPAGPQPALDPRFPRQRLPGGRRRRHQADAPGVRALLPGPQGLARTGQHGRRLRRHRGGRLAAPPRRIPAVLAPDAAGHLPDGRSGLCGQPVPQGRPAALRGPGSARHRAVAAAEPGWLWPWAPQ